MPVQLLGLEPKINDPETFYDRQGFGASFRIPMYGAKAGIAICVNPGVALYSQFASRTDLPVGAMMVAEDKGYATYIFTESNVWIPLPGQYTGIRNIGSNRAIDVEDNGAMLVNQLGADRSLSVPLNLPSTFYTELIQASTGTLTLVPDVGVTITGPSLVTAGPAKLLRLRAAGLNTFIAY